MSPAPAKATTTTTTTTTSASNEAMDDGVTFKYQSSLPRLPIPCLEDTVRKYLRALEGLQDKHEYDRTRKAVAEFLKGEGPKVQQRLLGYAKDKASYIEEFWYDSYLRHSDPVVLGLNPFFVLEDDPTPSRGSQLPRAASLIVSALGFIHDLRNGLLEPDTARGIPLDMDQYSRLFGTSRIPTENGCKMSANSTSNHIVVIRRGQFYYFDVLDSASRPVLTERDILRNLHAIVTDADQTPPSAVATSAVGVLTTENRKHWAQLRQNLQHSSKRNKECLGVIDYALFMVCLDDATPESTAELCKNFLCGTYRLEGGVQTGTCTNRWYDKLQIIVCQNGAAGINFEHTGVDGHTVLRFAADVYTDNLLSMARSINPSAPTLFKVTLSPYSKSSKNYQSTQSTSNGSNPQVRQLVTTPHKLEWSLTPDVLIGIRFAETRLSDMICQNDAQALEFTGFGKRWITKRGFSPDAFVQMAFQAGYYGLYGRIECTYEPAMTKAFLHGRTEAIRTVQPESVKFTKTFFSDASPDEKINALREACENHVRLTKECSKGLGQDRHLYALYCLLQREIEGQTLSEDGDSESSSTSGEEPPKKFLPAIFTDPGWHLINTSILSTSNCGNPALRLFGFGPVASDGFGIGYIIKDDAISICATSKHLQTRRFLDTIAQYLTDVYKLVNMIYRQANERSGAFVDHSGNLIDARTGSALVVPVELPEEGEDDGAAAEEEEEGGLLSGYSFFDSVSIGEALTGESRHADHFNVSI
ncbi:acyltransferase ChoActase/COT/CPT [Cantharellus anzutake]|uniref:acyltransferase ChoActase/COT/CPT n=1 Tax=Cantharellus anzutake TaxID=1750568 RepID=UPI001907E3AF|nr:acyltransferase ChoActase/COT/CPT [Cantharellus anzutake]KAF8332392.1 acyltransferase ChoActase/COT/CPT [Cantharellus anzutake]